jgi:predicted RNase H-like nuclease (RuvC/YqgF family)
MTRPAEWAEHEVTQLRAEVERLKRELTMALAEVDELRAALEPNPTRNKPDLRALLPELAVIRQVMKEPKP